MLWIVLCQSASPPATAACPTPGFIYRALFAARHPPIGLVDATNEWSNKKGQRIGKSQNEQPKQRQ